VLHTTGDDRTVAFGKLHGIGADATGRADYEYVLPWLDLRET
jgi:hypothetical protein